MSALIFLIDTFARLYLLTFLLRILLQVSRADFYNPIAQFIVQVTNPLVVPARRLIPSLRKFDLPTLVILVVLQAIVLLVLFALRGAGMLPLGTLFWLTIFAVLTMTLWTYIICTFVYVILSWVGQHSYSPFAVFLGQVIEPVLGPVRRRLPAIGGLDISPMILMIFLMAGILLLGDLSTLVL